MLLSAQTNLCYVLLLVYITEIDNEGTGWRFLVFSSSYGPDMIGSCLVRFPTFDLVHELSCIILIDYDCHL